MYFAVGRGRKGDANLFASGWVALLRAVKVRNRVTHPKCSRDLEVTDEEFQLLKQGASWFRRTLIAMFLECEKVYRESADALRKAITEN